MRYSVSLALATLLLGIAPTATCLGADPASPEQENTEPAGSKPAALPNDHFRRMAQSKIKAKPDGKYTPGSQAFYSSTTRNVSFYGDPQRAPAIIIVHENLHQLMDRFSEVSSIQESRN